MASYLDSLIGGLGDTTGLGGLGSFADYGYGSGYGNALSSPSYVGGGNNVYGGLSGLSSYPGGGGYGGSYGGYGGSSPYSAYGAGGGYGMPGATGGGANPYSAYQGSRSFYGSMPQQAGGYSGQQYGYSGGTSNPANVAGGSANTGFAFPIGPNTVRGDAKWAGGNGGDLFARRGEPIYAMFDGQVVPYSAGQSPMGPVPGLLLRGQNGLAAQYQHVQGVVTGPVRKGQQIGYVGDSSMDMLGAYGGMPDNFQHLDLTLGRGSGPFPISGGDINVGQFLSSMGYQGRVISGTTRGPVPGSGSGAAAYGGGGGFGQQGFGQPSAAGYGGLGGQSMARAGGFPQQGFGGFGQQPFGGFPSFPGGFGSFPGLGFGGASPLAALAASAPAAPSFGPALNLPVFGGFGQSSLFGPGGFGDVGGGFGGPGGAGPLGAASMMLSPFGGAGPEGAASMYGMWGP